MFLAWLLSFLSSKSSQVQVQVLLTHPHPPSTPTALPLASLAGHCFSGFGLLFCPVSRSGFSQARHTPGHSSAHSIPVVSQWAPLCLAIIAFPVFPLTPIMHLWFNSLQTEWIMENSWKLQHLYQRSICSSRIYHVVFKLQTYDFIAGNSGVGSLLK